MGLDLSANIIIRQLASETVECARLDADTLKRSTNV
jgi:hypothetical protein